MYEIRGMERSQAITWPTPSSERGEEAEDPLIVTSVSVLCLSVFAHCIFLYLFSLYLSQPGFSLFLFNLSDFCNLISSMWISLCFSPCLIVHVCLSSCQVSLTSVFSVFHVCKSLSYRVSSNVPASTFGCHTWFVLRSQLRVSTLPAASGWPWASVWGSSVGRLGAHSFSDVQTHLRLTKKVKLEGEWKSFHFYISVWMSVYGNHWWLFIQRPFQLFPY